MNSYWSCSKFAKWILPDKPLVLPIEEWDIWREETKKKHPVRFWIAEVALDRIQRFVTWPSKKIHLIKYYITNRWIDHTNALTAFPENLKPGQWHDRDGRILYCLFDEFVKFVEIELPSFRGDSAKHRRSWWKFWQHRTLRDPESGLKHLKWEANLVWGENEVRDKRKIGKPTPQADKAKVYLELYEWYTVTRKNRPDPMDASGLSDYYAKQREEHGSSLWAALRSNRDDDWEKMHKECVRLEEAYDKEDTEMLIKLIKNRHGMWT